MSSVQVIRYGWVVKQSQMFARITFFCRLFDLRYGVGELSEVLERPKLLPIVPQVKLRERS